MKKTGIILFLLLLFFSAVQPTAIGDFSLKNIEGGLFRLNDILGRKIIVVEFWATWCTPCKKLLKRLNTIQKQYRGQVEVVAISVDEASAFSAIESYIKVRGFEFTVLLDADSKVARIYNPTLKVPYTMIVNYQGEIVYTRPGYIPGVEHEIENLIRKILNS